MMEATKAVVQVIARGCPDGDRTGSGFLWEAPTQLVTDLHVIGGCPNIFAYSAVGGGEERAIPKRILRSADLALLEIPAEQGARSLRLSTRPARVNDLIQVIGYYYGVRSFDSRPLHVTIGSPILEDMLPQKVATTVRMAGSPNLRTEILRLDGNLVPGLSGAPLIDNTGAIVGIGSGGLENGTVGISWAVRAHYLNDLKNGPTVSTLPLQTASPSTLFSAPIAGKAASQVRCGDFGFAYAKTRTLADLLSSADDIPGLLALANTAALPSQQIQSIKFDVYAEQTSGGSIALPKGAHLIQSGHNCTVSIDSLDVVVSSSRVGNQFDVQTKSATFDAEFDSHGLMWGPDPGFTYLAPIFRADGLVVRRKNAVGFSAAGVPAADSFETLMTRGNVFVGIRVTNLNYNPMLFQKCRMYPATSQCPSVNALFKLWVATALGVQMSTFPPT
jgi:hypothetical protein